MKKIAKIIGIVLGLILVFLLVAPFLFKGSIEKLLKKNLNENLTAQVEWESLDLSLFKNFPNAAVVVENFSVVNAAPFEGDTLASGKRLALDMGITQLFKSSEDPIQINGLELDEALINIQVDSLGNASYDIAKKSETEPNESTEDTSSGGFSFDLNHYEINNSRINYHDHKGGTFLTLEEFTHEGNGDLSAATSQLVTTTQTKASFAQGDTQYLGGHSLTLDATFQLDLENQKYSFLENEAKINELPLTFDGFVQILEDGSDIDLTFTTPSSDFKNFLAVIPKKYVQNLDGVSTTGNFSVDGMVKGVANDTRIPTLDITVKSDNASFKYPDLPKAVRNISIDAQLKNDTGLVQDTYLTIGNLTFKIDEELFRANGSIRNLTENALVQLALKGTLNLANIEQVLPLELEQDLTGIFKADVSTRFDMRSLETEQYQNISTNGTASLSDFTYQDPYFSDKIVIDEADVAMTPGNITLNKFDAKTGETDIAATGSIQNLIPWIMAKQDLKGNFNVQSNTFNVSDFMGTESEEVPATGDGTTESATTATAEGEAIKIPDFLDATLNFDAKKVKYDNLELQNTKGTVTISDETAFLKNVSSNILGGNVALSGDVNTKQTTPTFSMNLDLQKIDIDQSFGQLAMLKYIAPIAQALDGNLNTTLNLQGKLNDDLTPDLKTIAGSALAQVITAQVDANKTPLLSKLGEQVSFLNLDKLSLQNVSTALDFSDGKIVVQPFDFKIEDINVTAGGSHGLDKSMNYQVTMDVPAKYLGGEVNNLLKKLDPAEADKTTVSLPIGIGGTFTSPAVNVDTKGAVSTLTQQLIEKQKQELTNKGTDILKDILGGGTKKEGDAKANSTEKTTEEQATEVVKDIFGGIFGKKKKKKDSTKSGN
ncbi:AsmA-like C-terminal region-containing protein [Aureisphaera galaxeae]|uniref:AsmA-like C-terminal region-containing protein n=1 Tax=Aureisphaera galaxeae TaxID=1538023 RepID=UPI002350A257|nr:AsmA-like C-terminal region-containing protein [Aureisphaera galaxeae]MDC8005753.1 AsmA-like C-terminal region-containing protein [Aureisphaera galaxeae]